MTEDTRDAVREEYAGDSADYDRVRLETARGRFLTDRDLAIFGRILPDCAGDDHLAEVGAGTGRFTLAALRRGYRVEATDANLNMMDALRSKVAEAGFQDRCSIRQESVFKLSWENGVWNLVVCLHVIPRFLTPDDQEAALRELCRVVLPGGRLLFNYRSASSWKNLIYKGPRIRKGRVARILTECGFVVEQARAKHLLSGTFLDAMPKFLWGGVLVMDRLLERVIPRHGWDVFILARREGEA